MENKMTARVEEVRGWRDWAKGKRTHEHGQQCGDCWGEWGLRGLKGNVKSTIKSKFKKEMVQSVFLNKACKTWLPANYLSFTLEKKIWPRLPSKVKILPQPQWSVIQQDKCWLWGFLGLSLPSTVGPRYPTKKLVINASFGLTYDQKGEAWMKKRPHTKPDKFRGGLCDPLKIQRPKVTTKDGLKLKLNN